MDVKDWAAIVQAGSAAIIVVLTIVLARTASQALSAAQAQSKSAADAIAEVRRDRHLDAVPMLSIKPGSVGRPGDPPPRTEMAGLGYVTGFPNVIFLIKNEGDTAALNVSIWLGESLGVGHPQDVRVAIAPELAMVGPHTEVHLPIDLSRFRRATEDRMLETWWVHISVTYEGLLGARITQHWYWQPDGWRGLSEPMPGQEAKLVLNSVEGTSGTEPGKQDLLWGRQ